MEISNVYGNYSELHSLIKNHYITKVKASIFEIFGARRKKTTSNFASAGTDFKDYFFEPSDGFPDTFAA